MNMPRLAACLLLACSCLDAAALQLGQLIPRSHLGEPLEAVVPLYGVDANDSADLAATIRPAIGTSRGDPTRAIAEGIETRVAHGANGGFVLVLTTTTPVLEPAVPFRLRLAHGRQVTVAHYALALPPPRDVPAVRSQRRPDLTLAPAATGYGPVAPGQTLSGIVRELGFDSRDRKAVMEWIVAHNPAAFVGGDADRLRVDVRLTVPRADVSPRAGRAAESRPANTPSARPDTGHDADAAQGHEHAAPVPTSMTSRTERPAAELAGVPVPRAVVTDTAPLQQHATTSDDVTATAARLAALSSKFAAIRARYAAQQAAPTASPPLARGSHGDAAGPGPDARSVPVSARAAATGATSQPAAHPADASDQGEPDVTAAASATPVKVRAEVSPLHAPVARVSERTMADALAGLGLAPLMFLGVAVLLLAMAATAAVRRGLHRRRNAREHGANLASDRELLAEIARKSEQRLKLEGEMAARLGRKRARSVTPREPEPAQDQRAFDEFDKRAFDEIDNRIAHGRYAEAENLLREVIAATPANHRAKMRLAEILYLNERSEEFVALALDLQARHRADIGDEGWQRVMRMGRVLVPDEPPFSGPVALEREA